MFRKNIIDASVPTELFSIYSILLFIAGMLFLIFLIFFHIYNHRILDIETSPNPRSIILGAGPTEVNKLEIYVQRITRVMFIVYALGLYLVFTVALDLVFFLSFFA